MGRRSRARDVTKGYTKSQFVAKLRRLADSIEHEKSPEAEEIEFQVTWKPERKPRR